MEHARAGKRAKERSMRSDGRDPSSLNLDSKHLKSRLRCSAAVTRECSAAASPADRTWPEPMSTSSQGIGPTTSSLILKIGNKNGILKRGI